MGIQNILIVNCVMAFSNFIAGIFPMVLKLNKNTKNFIKYFSCGFLLGIELIVLIPEGIERIYSGWFNCISGKERHCFATSFSQIDSSKGYIFYTHTLIGAYISIGFSIMILIEYFTNKLFDTSHVADQKKNDEPNITKSNYKRFGYLSNHTKKIIEFFLKILKTVDKPILLILIGIILHNIPEGIALGSSTEDYKDNTSDYSSYYLYLAIILHKIPEALSLCTLLLSKNYNKYYILFFMMVISIITPLLSLITYWAINLFSFGNFSLKDSILSKFSLISSGSLLYVSTIHLYHEIFNEGTHFHSKSETQKDSPNSKFTLEKNRLRNLAIYFSGLWSPLLLCFFEH